MPRLRTQDALVAAFPLAPLEEQRRIVAKAGGLMALCDELEEARHQREATRDRLTKANLGRLTAPDTDNETFRSHARFAADSLSAMSARAEQVKQLRQTILDLAVRGKLVEQDPADDTVADTLQAIQSERESTLKSMGLRRGKPVLPVLDDDLPYGIPDS